MSEHTCEDHYRINGQCNVCGDVEKQATTDSRQRQDTAADFHAHLDICAQCRDYPFALCAEGARRLQKAALI